MFVTSALRTCVHRRDVKVHNKMCRRGNSQPTEIANVDLPFATLLETVDIWYKCPN